MQTTEATLETRPSRNLSLRDLLFSYTGRIARVHHITLFVFWLSVFFMGSWVIYHSFIFTDHVILRYILATATLIIMLFAALNLVMIKILRLHDMNLSAWWLLLGLIPILNIGWILCIFVMGGTKTANRYGEVPEKTGMKSLAVVSVSLAFICAFYLFIGEDKLVSWHHYQDAHYSIEYPGTPDKTNKTTEQYKLNSASYSNRDSDYLMQSSVYTLKEKHYPIGDILLKTPAEAVIRDDFSTMNVSNIVIVSDKKTTNQNLSSREINATMKIEHRTYDITEKTTADTKHGLYYYVMVTHQQRSDYQKIAQHFLNSFKIKAS